MKRIMVDYDGMAASKKAFDFSLGTICPGEQRPEICVLSVMQRQESAAAG